MSKYLTEQWKKGELESGWYYINDGQIDYKYSKHSSVDFFVTPHEDIKQILAPVPSYKEWQKVLNIDFNNEVLRLENAKLKELLRDLRDEADGALQAIQKDCESDDWSIFHYPEVQYFYDLLTKIDNAIGEKNNGN